MEIFIAAKRWNSLENALFKPSLSCMYNMQYPNKCTSETYFISHSADQT